MAATRHAGRSRNSRSRTGRTKSGRKASESVRTEMHHMRSGKHKVKSRKQAIAIGLNKARAKGAKVPRKSGGHRRTHKAA